MKPFPIDRSPETLPDALLRKLTELALRGDQRCLLAVTERLFPSPRGRLVRLAIDPVTDAASALAGLAAIADATARGEISGTEAAELCKPFETYIRTLETAGLPQDRTFTINIGQIPMSPALAEVAGEDALSGPPEADPGEETDVAPGIEPAGTPELVEINSREIARVAKPSFEDGLAQALAWSRQPRVRKF
jgi:hypothetical protein